MECHARLVSITSVYIPNYSLKWWLKHKDSFGKSENLSKIFFTEILVFDHDYEGKSSSSNGLLWISFFYFSILIIFRIVRRASEQIYTCYQLYFARCNYYQIVNLTRFKAWKLFRNTLDSVLSNIYRTSFIFLIFLYQNYICALSSDQDSKQIYHSRGF